VDCTGSRGVFNRTGLQLGNRNPNGIAGDSDSFELPRLYLGIDGGTAYAEDSGSFRDGHILLLWRERLLLWYYTTYSSMRAIFRHAFPHFSTFNNSFNIGPLFGIHIIKKCKLL
jgi:hypothetical protein